MKHTPFVALLAVSAAACGFVKVQTFGPGGQGANAAPSSSGTSAASLVKNDDDTSGGRSSSGSSRAAEKAANPAVETRKAIAEIDGALSKDATSPVAADKIAALEDKAKALDTAGNTAGAKAARHALTYYKLENAWRGDATKSADAIAALAGGTVKASGQVTGKDKPQPMQWHADADKCYVLFTHLKSVTSDDDGLKALAISAGAPADESTLERFRVEGRRSQGSKSWTYGACATKSTDVTASAKLSYAGSDNALRYVVVETPRASFPQWVAASMVVYPTDSCDADNWQLLWTNPIPGSIVYGGTQPFMPTSWLVGDLWMDADDAAGREARLQATQITSAPPASIKFGEAFKFKGCSHDPEYAASVDGKKIAQCYANLDKKYTAQIDAAQNAKENARTIFQYAAANQRIKALNAASDRDEERLCVPLEKKAEQKMNDAYTHIVDFYAKTPFKNSFDRAADMGALVNGLRDRD